MIKNKFNSLMYLVLSSIMCFSSYVWGVDVTINWNDVRQEIDGFGGCTFGYSGLSSAEIDRINDFLFLQTDGNLGLSMIRMFLSSGIEPSKDVWNWGAQNMYINDANLAKERNPDIKVWTAPWSPPGWMKYSGQARGSGATFETSQVKPECYQDLADYFSTVCRVLKSSYNIELCGISFQNEPDLFVSYQCCIWPYDNKVIDFIKNYMKPTFERDGVTTPLVAAEHSWWNNEGGGVITVLNMLLDDPDCRDFVGIGAAHQYWNLETAPLDKCKQYGKRTWQTEVSTIGDDPDEHKNCLLMARYIHENMTHAESNAWHYYELCYDDTRWALLNSIDDIPTRAYILGNYSRFIRPGYYRVGMTGSGTQSGIEVSDVYVSSYKDLATNKFVIVAINNSTSQQELNITFNGFSATSLTPYITSRTQGMEHLSDITVSGSTVPLTLPAETVVTYTGTAVSGQATQVILLANPVSIKADGTSTSQITAMICDANGNTVTDSNATISFSLSGDAGGSLSSISVQATNGTATVTYTAGSSIGTATITGTSTDLMEGTVTITLLNKEVSPVISVSTTTINFGEITVGSTKMLPFTIQNIGVGALTGTITTDKTWIIVNPTSFSIGEGSSQEINITIDNEIAAVKEGILNGKLTITSNGSSQPVEITVTFTATCVLVAPNPYNPEKGVLTFFGNGIVPNNTEIRIYTLDGELVRILKNEFEWDGTNEDGKLITNGIYIYTYESPKEKGVGKFTVLRR